MEISSRASAVRDAGQRGAIMCENEKAMTGEEKEARRRVLDELATEAQHLGFYDDPPLMIPKSASGSPDPP